MGRKLCVLNIGKIFVMVTFQCLITLVLVGATSSNLLPGDKKGDNHHHHHQHQHEHHPQHGDQHDHDMGDTNIKNTVEHRKSHSKVIDFSTAVADG